MKWILVVILIFIPLLSDAYTPMDTANAVVHSLKTNPDHWFHDAHKLYYFKDKDLAKETKPYYWESKADCIIWIANGEDSVSIEKPKKVFMPRKARQFIWDTYQKWANDFYAEIFEVKPEVKITIKTEDKTKSIEKETNKTSKKVSDVDIYIPLGILIMLLVAILLHVIINGRKDKV